MSGHVTRSLAVVVALCVVTLAASPTWGYGEEESLERPTIDLALTSGFSFDHPFVARGGLGFKLALRPVRLFGADLVVQGMLDLGEPDYSRLNPPARYEEGMPPVTSHMTSAVLLSFVTSPLVGRLRNPAGPPHLVDWYLLVGGGGVQTRDNTTLLRSPCDGLTTVRERKADTANGCQYVDQFLPAFTMATGLRGRFGGVLLLGLEVRLIAFEEQFFRDESGGGELANVDQRYVWWSSHVGVALPPAGPRRRDP